MNYEKHITDLTHAVQADSYGNAFARLASGQIDVLCCYADARRDNEEKWTTEFGRTASIWDETNVIGVTDGIYNDTISVSKTSKVMDDAFKAAIIDKDNAAAEAYVKSITDKYPLYGGTAMA